MSRIEIEWLEDSSDCETCGPSYADGAIVKIDGAVALDMTPVAGCLNGSGHDSREVLMAVLRHLGHTVEETL